MTIKPAILFISTEVFPFAKTGGLADVSSFLPKSLRSQGYDVRVMMPKFKGIEEKYGHQLQVVATFDIEFAGKKFQCGVESIAYNDNMIYFINNPYYFDRDRIYDYDDEMERFVFFCKAVMDCIPFLGFKPNILHCNDWLTGFVPFFLKTQYRELDFYKDMKSIFTIHALLYQGVFNKKNTKDLLNLEWDYFVEHGLDYYDQVNCMKVGIMLADVVSTVSPSYAAEISKISPMNIEPLTETLFKRRRNLHGILNGIDMDENNPAADPRLFANYDADNLQGKAENKRRLQETFNLPVRADVPIVAIISRLEITKGLYLIEKSFHEMLKEDMQFVVIGDGIPYYDYLFTNIMKAFPDKMYYSAYNDDIAYKTYAGADIFLMPSYTEACGISQLIGMRYGTVPIIRETGGLRDTVQHYDERTGEGTGFTFKYASQWVMLDAIRKSMEVYHKKEQWHKLVTRVMKLPVGWENSTKEYMKLYENTANMYMQQNLLLT
ncbi:glycogen synthase [Paenibacillus oenotherae]|uniref:Glycogen synthase n=1 Tax=Paenibacillus oenotherae TaxID=1435645 RepID=A0ABS7D5Z3_9BACL|nr:glycogen/starch synthase [Paenibacillus oenotherae]MBW7475198.1 glycogen synthase [Paenibacillus oenotherae]